MTYIRPPVSTVCVGAASSMAALLLVGGEAGKRFALPHSSIMIHQPLGGFTGQASDIAIHAQEILGLRARMNKILAGHTGQSEERIQQDTERDRYLSAEEAKEYGLIDEVILPRKP